MMDYKSQIHFRLDTPARGTSRGNFTSRGSGGAGGGLS